MTSPDSAYAQVHVYPLVSMCMVMGAYTGFLSNGW